MIMRCNTYFTLTDENSEKNNRVCNMQINVEGDSASIEYMKNSLPVLLESLSDMIVDCEVERRGWYV